MVHRNSVDCSCPEDASIPVADLHYPALPARPRSLAGLRHVLRRWASGTGLNDSQIKDLVLSVDEAATNVVEHAYLHRHGALALQAIRRSNPARVEATITDHGRWRDAARQAHGRGFALIEKLTDRSDVRSGDHGTTVVMAWLVPARRSRSTRDPDS